MKKNYMMRLAAVLLVLVLLSTCVISGTFAKYTTTTGELKDTATVTKWGIKMTLTSEDVLYDADSTDDDVVELKVANKDLAAPGTKEQLASFAIEGKPEVAYEIKVVTDLKLANWSVDGTYYCPLTIKVNDVTINGLDKSSATEFEEAVEAAVKAAIEGKYNANVDSAKTVVIEWSWAFEGDNVKDTALGDAATKATIEFTLNVTATQVD